LVPKHTKTTQKGAPFYNACPILRGSWLLVFSWSEGWEIKSVCVLRF